MSASSLDASVNASAVVVDAAIDEGPPSSPAGLEAAAASDGVDVDGLPTTLPSVSTVPGGSASTAAIAAASHLALPLAPPPAISSRATAIAAAMRCTRLDESAAAVSRMAGFWQSAGGGAGVCAPASQATDTTLTCCMAWYADNDRRPIAPPPHLTLSSRPCQRHAPATTTAAVASPKHAAKHAASLLPPLPPFRVRDGAVHMYPWMRRVPVRRAAKPVAGVGTFCATLRRPPTHLFHHSTTSHPSHHGPSCWYRPAVGYGSRVGCLRRHGGSAGHPHHHRLPRTRHAGPRVGSRERPAGRGHGVQGGALPARRRRVVDQAPAGRVHHAGCRRLVHHRKLGVVPGGRCRVHRHADLRHPRRHRCD